MKRTSCRRWLMNNDEAEPIIQIHNNTEGQGPSTETEPTAATEPTAMIHSNTEGQGSATETKPSVQIHSTAKEQSAEFASSKTNTDFQLLFTLSSIPKCKVPRARKRKAKSADVLTSSPHKIQLLNKMKKVTSHVPKSAQGKSKDKKKNSVNQSVSAQKDKKQVSSLSTNVKAKVTKKKNKNHMPSR